MFMSYAQVMSFADRGAAMALSSTHHRFGHGAHPRSDATSSSLRETIEHGTYTALLATAGFIIVNLLKVAERREGHAERSRR